MYFYSIMGKSIEINAKLYSNIEEYCFLNSIENIDEEIESYVIQGFNIARYGLTPFTRDIPMNEEKHVDKKPIEKVEIIEIKPKEEEKPIEKKVTRKPTKKVRIIKSE